MADEIRYAKDSGGGWHAFKLIPHPTHGQSFPVPVSACGALIVVARVDIALGGDLCAKCKKALKS
jgi:hypothetical protein